MATSVAFAIPGESIPFWQERLQRHGVAFSEAIQFGAPLLRFDDPHGLTLELVTDPAPPTVKTWTGSAVPAAHAIRGFFAATILTHEPDATEALLTGILGMTLEGREGDRRRFRMAASEAPGHFLDVVGDPAARQGRPGGGTVHHIALRAADRQEQAAWRRSLVQAGYNPTPVTDRNYFESIYFREPGGVLFEIATDPPGFAVDEAPSELGARLQLPPRYAAMRTKIAKQLPALRPMDFRHVFQRPDDGRDDGVTIATFHGTGGDEHDLVAFARSAHPVAAILSPRGKVSENGMARFFRRSASGVLDETDVVRRAHELADFLCGAARHYGRDPEGLTALGYSNGANVAAAMLLLRPEIFTRAVLLRPMMPLSQVSPQDLNGKAILILKGRQDRVIPAAGSDRLAAVLAEAGARVTLKTLETGHALTPQDLEMTSRWLAGALDTARLAATGS